ncbi:MAG: hypothetical protein OXE94_11140 [Aestuariivita sp.]|nr:hypothetical protein [Aestuariivita sp.]
MLNLLGTVPSAGNKVVQALGHELTPLFEKIMIVLNRPKFQGVRDTLVSNSRLPHE